jgi:hypothetical protein
VSHVVAFWCFALQAGHYCELSAATTTDRKLSTANRASKRDGEQLSKILLIAEAMVEL